MATTSLRRVDPVSLGKVMGLCYALLGLIAGLILGGLSVVGAGFASMMADSNQPWLGTLFGVGAIIFLPLLYGLLGFIVWLIFGLVLNLVLGWAGGLQVELG